MAKQSGNGLTIKEASRLVLDAWDRMERGELPAPEPYDQRTAAAQQITNTGKDYSVDNPLFGAGPLFDHPDGSRS